MNGGQISNSYAKVKLEDIPCGTGSIQINQEFSVNFITNKNQVRPENQVSGNPGYILGSPVRIGDIDASGGISITNVILTKAIYLSLSYHSKSKV